MYAGFLVFLFVVAAANDVIFIPVVFVFAFQDTTARFVVQTLNVFPFLISQLDSSSF